MQPPYPQPLAAWGEDEFVANGHLAGEGGAGDHHAGPGDAEHPVHRQAKAAAGVALAHLVQGREQGGAQRGDAGAAGAGHRIQRRPGEGPGSQQRTDLLTHLGQSLGVHPIGLGQGHQQPGNAEQFEDRQVLAGLGHDAIVGRHHQQGQIQAAGAGQHVVHEALVAGYVDEAGEAAVAQVGIDIAQVDGDATRLLFAAAVTGDPGEGLDQRGLAMVDVAGGADDHGDVTRRENRGVMGAPGGGLALRVAAPRAPA